MHLPTTAIEPGSPSTRSASPAVYLVTEKVEQLAPWTEPRIELPCGGGALRPTIS